MVLMPSRVSRKRLETGKVFSRSVPSLQVTPSNAEVRLVDQPNGDFIFVALDRVRRCYLEQENTTWTGRKQRRKQKHSKRGDSSVEKVVQLLPKGPVTCSKTRGRERERAIGCRRRPSGGNVTNILLIRHRRCNLEVRCGQCCELVVGVRATLLKYRLWCV
jgi:hypothetical protein